jgi:hypothetical protein
MIMLGSAHVERSQHAPKLASCIKLDLIQRNAGSGGGKDLRFYFTQALGRVLELFPQRVVF